MPKEAIRFALRQSISTLRANGHTGVAVPRASRPCMWKPRKGTKWIPFDTMYQVLEFSLDNAYVQLPTGIYKQMQGIPMGDPESPGMTIGTCGWMESEWLQSICATTTKFFQAGRYMDDILLPYVKAPTWSHEKFLSDFQTECYHKPLTLEEGTEGTFLETSFTINNGEFQYWLKNDNRLGFEPRVWRYQHYHSYGPFMRKRATLVATLRKVHNMASCAETLCTSAVQKLAEFQRLEYPPGLLKAVCHHMYVTTNSPAWREIRHLV